MLSEKYIAGLLDSDGSIGLKYNKTSEGFFHCLVRVSFSESPSKANILVDVQKVLGGRLYEIESSGSFGKYKIRNLEIVGSNAVSALRRLQKYIVVKNGLIDFVCNVNGKNIQQSEKDELRKEIKRVRLTSQRLPNYLSRKWMAAYVDGNGCITGGLRKKSGKFEPKIDVTAWKADTQVLELMKKQYGGIVNVGHGETAHWLLSLCVPSKCIEVLEYLEHVIIIKPQRDYILSLARNGSFQNGSEIREKLMALNSRSAAETKPEGVI